MGVIDERTVTLKCDTCGFTEVVHTEKLCRHMRRAVIDPTLYGWVYVAGNLCCPKHTANIELLTNVLLAASEENIVKPDVPERKREMKQVRIF